MACQSSTQDGHKPEDVIQDVKIMHKIAMGRRRRRFASGSLALNQPKLCFKRDKDGRPQFKHTLLRTQIVWLKSIYALGKLLSRRKVDPRTEILHQFAASAPLKKKLYEFTSKVMQRGYHLNAATAGDLQKSLNEVSYT